MRKCSTGCRKAVDAARNLLPTLLSTACIHYPSLPLGDISSWSWSSGVGEFSPKNGFFFRVQTNLIQSEIKTLTLHTTESSSLTLSPVSLVGLEHAAKRQRALLFPLSCFTFSPHLASAPPGLEGGCRGKGPMAILLAGGVWGSLQVWVSSGVEGAQMLAFSLRVCMHMCVCVKGVPARTRVLFWHYRIIVWPLISWDHLPYLWP